MDKKVNWKERAKKLRDEMKSRQPIITVSIVMELFGFTSSNTAINTLEKLEEMGVVRHAENHRWYLE